MTDRIIEAVLFASDTPVEVSRLRDLAGGVSEAEVLAAVDALNRLYEETGRTFRITGVAGGFQFESLSAWGPYIERLFGGRTRPKLSRAALETLAIVAYKQPIARADIDVLRGVDSDAPIRTLQNRDLIEVAGRADTVGKPLLYGTTQEFLRYFGLKQVKDLPGADELASMFDGTEPEPVDPGQLALAGIDAEQAAQADMRPGGETAHASDEAGEDGG